MSKAKSRKHNIDIMFLMILFLIFTFSAVSVLLMAVNSYRSVVSANESNAVRQHDNEGAVDISKIDGTDCIRMAEGEGFYLYVYEYDGYLMALEAKDGSGVTADFGDKILKIKSMDFEKASDSNTIYVNIEDENGEKEQVSIGIKSSVNKTPVIEEPQEKEGDHEE